MEDSRHASCDSPNNEPWVKNSERDMRSISSLIQCSPVSLVSTQEGLSTLQLTSSSQNVLNPMGPLQSTPKDRKLLLDNSVRLLGVHDKPRECGGVWKSRYGVRPVVYLRFSRAMGASSRDQDGSCGGCGLPLLSTSSLTNTSSHEVPPKSLLFHSSRPFAPPLPSSQLRRICGIKSSQYTNEATCVGSLRAHCRACLREIGPNQFRCINQTTSCSSNEQIIFLKRDECVMRERIVDDWIGTFPKFSLPPHLCCCPSIEGDVNRSAELENSEERLALNSNGDGVSQACLRHYSHPMLLLAIERLSAREFLARRQIVDEEAERFSKQFDKLGRYLRCLAPNGSTTRPDPFLRAWIAKYRAQKVIRLCKLEQLKDREDAARRDLVNEMNFERHQLCVRFLEEMESIERRNIMYLQLLTSYSHGVIAIKLAEQVERFPILFGAPMSRVKSRIFIEAHTVFRGLILQEEHYRDIIVREEHQEWNKFFVREQQQQLTEMEEVAERRSIEAKEAGEYRELVWQIFLLEMYHTFRDVEQYEAATRAIEFQWPGKAPLESQE